MISIKKSIKYRRYFEKIKQNIYSALIHYQRPWLNGSIYRQELPTLSDKKLSKNKYCCRLLYLYVNPLFFGTLKVYKTWLDHSVSGTRKRPDISCVINGIPILNSEVKPLGYTPLQKKKDSIKVQLRAKKSINEQLNTKGGPC